MSNALITHRNDVLRRSDPAEMRQFIIDTGGNKPPEKVNWQDVALAARKSIRDFPEFDETYGYDELDEPEFSAAGDLIFPRRLLLDAFAALTDSDR